MYVLRYLFLFSQLFFLTKAGGNNFNPAILAGRANRIEDVNLRFYNGAVQEYVDIPLGQARSLLDARGFVKDNPTVLYIHGYVETVQQESIRVIVSAYLESKPETNIVLLDWSNMAQGSYLLNAVGNSKTVGVAAAVQLNNLIDSGLRIDKLHIIGYSIGCHVAGYLARDLKNKYYKTVKRLTALDPAYLSFYPGALTEHVSANDAEFVDVIHTNPGGYGTPVSTGTADFWVNGVHMVQPGCPLFAPILLSDDNLCSHWRSWRYYAESVRNPVAFPASPASSYLNFQRNPNPEVGMVYMGVNCDINARGSYYLTTNSVAPFGRGLNGIYIRS